MGVKDIVSISVQADRNHKPTTSTNAAKTENRLKPASSNESFNGILLHESGGSGSPTSMDSSTETWSSVKSLSSLSSATTTRSIQSSFSTSSTPECPPSKGKKNFRSKYFMKLGVLEAASQGFELEVRARVDREDSDSLQLVSTPALVEAPEVLKADGGRPDKALSLTSSPVSPCTRKASKKERDQGVCFETNVRIRIIPGRQNLSQLVKNSLWMSMPEFLSGVERNTTEFASEGYDWRNAIEEEHFVFWNGQWIHPIHPHTYYNSELGSSGGVPASPTFAWDAVLPQLTTSHAASDCCTLKRPFLMYMMSTQQQ